jgi:molybdopterin/thiamine biosynthesis adenylyltransferase/proteasome lid subunit RPN8/RPN11
MTTYSLTLLESHYDAICETALLDTRERGAFLVCGRSSYIDPWTGEREERFLGREVVEVSESDFLERHTNRMTWSTTPFYQLLKRVEPKAAAIAVFHSHPHGPLAFSTLDDVAERELFGIALNRLDGGRPHLSVIIDGNGDLVARAYDDQLRSHPVRLIRVIGKRWRFWYRDRGSGRTPAELERQVRALGSASTEDIAQLRVGMAGCGGTGSATAMLMARIGARRMAFFDSDYIDETNLNRLHFATRRDANLREKKVDVLGRGVAELGLPISVMRFPYAVDDERVRDAVRSCDVIFGCTDDNLGRSTLNRLAHFYEIPVIDMGVLIEPNDAGGYDVFDGRVTVIQPGHVCLRCRGTIDTDLMLAEGLRRSDPTIYEQRRRAGYVVGAPDPSPVVVTFTTEVATMAVNELLQRLNGFRGENGSCSERVRRFSDVKDADTVPSGRSSPDCRVCGTRKYDGRGDMEPFLDQA